MIIDSWCPAERSKDLLLQERAPAWADEVVARRALPGHTYPAAWAQCICEAGVLATRIGAATPAKHDQCPQERTWTTVTSDYSQK